MSSYIAPDSGQLVIKSNNDLDLSDISNKDDAALAVNGGQWVGGNFFINGSLVVNGDVITLGNAPAGNLDIAGSGSVVYDQSLNTTDDVQFNSISVTEITTESLIINATGPTEINSAADINFNAVDRVKISSQTPFRLANMDTVTRDAIIAPENGDMIYNTDTNKFQGYASGVWVDLN